MYRIRVNIADYEQPPSSLNFYVGVKNGDMHGFLIRVIMGQSE